MFHLQAHKRPPIINHAFWSPTRSGEMTIIYHLPDWAATFHYTTATTQS